MSKKQLFVAFVIAFLAANAYSSYGVSSVDLMLLNGRFWTLDPARPWTEGVLIREGTIYRAGSNEEIRACALKGTRSIDLQGSLVLPGFIDCHTHFLNGGFALSSIQLKDAKSREEFVSRFKSKAGGIGAGEWILNGTWDEERFDPPELPAKGWIDGVTPLNPVFVRRYDLHMGLANSLALKIAGITKDTKAPAGGEILKDPVTGEPTGILKETAMNLVTDVIPEPSLKENVRAAEAALQCAAENGVTSVHDLPYHPSDFTASLMAYQELYKAGKLTARLCLYVPIDEIDLILRLGLKSSFGSDYLKIGGLKGFVDGGLGARTAFFFEPYADDPSNRGALTPQMSPEGIMEQRILQADRAGLQVAIHAIGDRANNIILDIFQRVIDRNGPGSRRWRIEHAQHLRPEDILRFGRMGIIASVQPYHAIDDGRWAEKRIGKERCRTTYAFKSLAAGRARLIFGSDWIVAPLEPILGIYAAVTRETLDGKNPGGWYPEQKLSLEQAIRAYTIDAAYAEYSENLKGSIEAGKMADLVVLDRNLFTISPEAIKGARVEMTIVGGEIVYRRPEGTASARVPGGRPESSSRPAELRQ
jgi:predicted amidohydrolase YtcJ